MIKTEKVEKVFCMKCGRQIAKGLKISNPEPVGDRIYCSECITKRLEGEW